MICKSPSIDNKRMMNDDRNPRGWPDPGRVVSYKEGMRRSSELWPDAATGDHRHSQSVRPAQSPVDSRSEEISWLKHISLANLHLYFGINMAMTYFCHDGNKNLCQFSRAFPKPIRITWSECESMWRECFAWPFLSCHTLNQMTSTRYRVIRMILAQHNKKNFVLMGHCWEGWASRPHWPRPHNRDHKTWDSVSWSIIIFRLLINK